jgi:hypothetical protein
MSCKGVGMTTAEKILGALEVERVASGYYVAAAATAISVEAPDFASVDAGGSAELNAAASMAFTAEQPQIVA